MNASFQNDTVAVQMVSELKGEAFGAWYQGTGEFRPPLVLARNRISWNWLLGSNGTTYINVWILFTDAMPKSVYSFW